MSKYGKIVNEYVEKIKAGDKNYLALLVELTFNHLANVARTYLINKADAEDVVADTFRKIERAYKTQTRAKTASIGFAVPFKTWRTTITKSKNG